MTINEANEYFKGDKFATEAAEIVIDEITEDGAKCSFEINDIHKAAHGGVMGGAIFTLADFTFAVAVNTKESLTYTIGSNITYLGQPKGKRLIAECKYIKNGKSTCTCEIMITDELGTKVATVISNGMHINK